MYFVTGSFSNFRVLLRHDHPHITYNIGSVMGLSKQWSNGLYVYPISLFYVLQANLNSDQPCLQGLPNKPHH